MFVRGFFFLNIIILCLISTFILINTEPSTVIFSLYSDFISLMIDTCRIYGSTSQQYDQLEKEKRGKKEKEKTLKKQTNKTSDDKIDTTTTTSSKALVDGSLLLGYFVLLRQIFIFSFQICINLYLENVTVNQWDWCKLKVPGVWQSHVSRSISHSTLIFTINHPVLIYTALIFIRTSSKSELHLRPAAIITLDGRWHVSFERLLWGDVIHLSCHQMPLQACSSL